MCFLPRKTLQNFCLIFCPRCHCLRYFVSFFAVSLALSLYFSSYSLLIFLCLRGKGQTNRTPPPSPLHVLFCLFVYFVLFSCRCSFIILFARLFRPCIFLVLAVCPGCVFRSYACFGFPGLGAGACFAPSEALSFGRLMAGRVGFFFHFCFLVVFASAHVFANRLANGST